MTFEEISNAVADMLRADGYFPEPRVVHGVARVCVAAKVHFLETVRLAEHEKRAFMAVATAHAVRALYHGDEKHNNPPHLSTRVLEHIQHALVLLYNIQMVPMETEEKVMFLNLDTINDGHHLSRGAMFRYAGFRSLPDVVTAALA